MKTLVIGATGIIGNHIVRELLEQGHEVIAASRGVTPSLNLEDLDIQRIKADITDVKSLEKAFKGIDWVFQAAAYYPGNSFQKAKHVKTALEGVRSVIQATKNSSIQRLVYTSSLTTIGRAKKGDLADEDLPYDLVGRDPHPYFLVKHLCEEELRYEADTKKCPIVIVNPTGCFGPYELKPKNMCLIPQLIERKVPAYVLNDINVVDTKDVAKGHILAAKKGRIGERYILGGHNMTMEMVIKEICELAGVKPPKLIVPIRLGLAACYVSETFDYVLKRSPRLPALGLRFAQYGQHMSIDKATEELGYKVQPMTACYERAIEWYKKIGYC